MITRTALVTGAAGGLGRAMAAALAKAGHRVVLLDRAESAARSAADSIRVDAPNAEVAPLAADLGEDADADEIAASAARAFGPIDVLVNNAGLGLDAVRKDFMQRPIDFTEPSPELIRAFFAVNAITPFLLARAVAPGMAERGFGRIVNVTTSLDSMLRKGFAPYGGSKAALEAHSAIMAADLEGTGVTVNVLAPGGPADTGMIPAETGFPREKLIQPIVMAAPLLFLVSEAGSMTSGLRVLAARWRDDLAPPDALALSSAPIGWPQLGTQTQWPDHPPRAP
jgi:NAD(P)-dependent dehydrogenase (short-subunit alcohol dehydrogenase family)